MKITHIAMIVLSFALVLILPQTVFAHMIYNFNNPLDLFNTNYTRMTKLVHDGAILITNQTMKKTEYKMGEKIRVYPVLTNIGNKDTSISYMWHPFFAVISFQNGTVMWTNGPSVPMMEYSSNMRQTLQSNVPLAGGIHDVSDPRYSIALYVPGNYTASSVADFYFDDGSRNLVWSEPIKFTVLPEKYSVADMNMQSPLQQFLSGIPTSRVHCGYMLELLIKTNTGLPICVKHNDATKLVERDWATKAPTQIPVVVMPQGFDDSHSGKTFEPSLIKVVIGVNNTVHWTNKAFSADTILSDDFKASNSFGEIFGGPTMMPGDTYEFTFTNSGTYGYHGELNSWNKGKVIVLPPSNLPEQLGLAQSENINPLGVTALVLYSPPDSCLGLSCPPYTFYLKMNANSTAYLLGYDVCGNDLCVRNNTLSVLLPIKNMFVANYTFIGLSDNKKWNYGDPVDIRLELSSSENGKDAYFLDIKNSTIVP